MVEEFERKYGKEAEKLRQQELKEKKKSLVGNYLVSLQQNCYMNEKRKDMRKKGRRNRRKIGNDGKISQDEET